MEKTQIAHNYGGFVTGSNGRLSEDEAFVLMQNTRFGSAAYPISKIGTGWTWGPVRGIKGPPKKFSTKREAVSSFESYLDILRDKLAGRL